MFVGRLRLLNTLQMSVAKFSTGILKNSKLNGKVAVVTASTDGIGLAIARDLGKNGSKVVISSRKQEHVSTAIKQLEDEGLDVRGTVCHVGKAKDRAHLIDFTLKNFGAIDILVSNAGTNPIFGSILDTDEDAWDKIFDVNVKASFFLAKDFANEMTKNGGSIVFVSSIAGFHPLPGLGAYSISKTALIGLTKALSVECAKKNIRVNCVAPGIIKTSFSSALWSNESIKKQVLQQIPMGRIGTPEDVAGVVTFLASEDSSYISGETMLATGGMPSRL